VLVRDDGERLERLAATEREAQDLIARVARQIHVDCTPRTIKEAIVAYESYLREKGNKPNSRAATTFRLKNMFAAVLDSQIRSLTAHECGQLYEGIVGTRAVDTHRNTLSECKTFLAWCADQRWLRANPMEKVQGIGKRRRGKAQLRIDEARKWLGRAVERAKDGDAGAVAAMMTLLLGLRCSEVVSRVVRDLDDNGRLLWIPESKTEAGRRTLIVPDLVRPFLTSMARGKNSTDLLFGKHHRSWPRKWV